VVDGEQQPAELEVSAVGRDGGPLPAGFLQP
jgi:hypothetical protein